MAEGWPTKQTKVASLHLDIKNPRLGREHAARAPREIIQHLFENYKAFEIADSIATRGYFPNEPLLAINEGDRLVVIEGNRRLAALKALREPGLLEGKYMRKVETLARSIDKSSLLKVPVTVAPSRRETDGQIAGRHIGTPVYAWKAENRASFILDKLDEGYDNDALRDELGFTLTDIQKARQTRAIADMARSLALPDEVRAKLEGPKTKVFTTLERVFNSTVGRQHLCVELSSEHGIRGVTSKKQFLKGFTRLVTDIALGKKDSRSLNKNEDIEAYFNELKATDRVEKKRGSFVPADIVRGKTVASAPVDATRGTTQRRPVPGNKNVLPRDLKIRYGNPRIADIYRELKRLKRAEFPNAGAVLLRVFFELTVLEYLKRSGELDNLKARLKGKGDRLPFDTPNLKQLAPEITKIAKKRLSAQKATAVEKAVRYDRSAPFSVNDLHSFVHSPQDLPGERDILTFWLRVEPLVRLMLQDGPEEDDA